jgi:protein SCO1
MKLLLLAVAGLGICLSAGCREKGTAPASASGATQGQSQTAGATNGRFYIVYGVVKKLPPAENSVTIQHEEIPNYMAAMTMPFKVKDRKELDRLRISDSVVFRLWVTEEESWIDQVQKVEIPKTAAPPVSAPPEREAFRVARDVEPLSVGDKMTDYRFTNELGQAISLSDFRGQALAFTFIYTRCPLPDFCPRMSKNFLEVYRQLARLPNAPTNWHLLTISFDPHFDTPAVLQSYAQAYQYHPDRWNFVTGAMIDIDAITDQFNLTIAKEGNQWDHKIRTVVVDTTGRIQQIIIGNTWIPETLVAEIIKAAAVKNSGAPPTPNPAGDKTAG